MSLERIDKIISSCGLMSRSECRAAAKRGRISVNGIPVSSSDVKADPEKDEIKLDGSDVGYKKHVYIMLNKPEGYVSATEDESEKTALELLGERERKLGLFPCGRLDKNTTGLLIFTNNGALAHRLLSPSRHVEKEYIFDAKYPLSDEDVKRLERGVDIGEYITAPCLVERLEPNMAKIVITEGKYHQIKLMLRAIGNQVKKLKRVRFDSITLEDGLEPGEWRYLTDGEIESLERHSV